MDLNSVVALADRTTVGVVVDVFGTTSQPYYVVLPTSGVDGVKVGDALFTVSEHSTFIQVDFDRNVLLDQFGMELMDVGTYSRIGLGKPYID
jgi:hypothetical protein